MKEQMKAPRGTKDLYGSEMIFWRKIEQVIRELCDDYGVEEIRTPIFEHTELFQRGVGETTDIVQKEMYTFVDKGERSLTLKPEGTAGVVRAYIEQKLFAQAQPIKLYYITPAFRYERPQAGRFRQFHQFGMEVFGSDEPTADAEVISMAAELLSRVGITDVELRVNSLGGPECRKKYNETLKAYIGENLPKLCATCQERYEKNPLRVLDCKVPDCKHLIENAPSVLDILDIDCREHFEKLQRILTEMGISFVVDPSIVRGLDYYTKTVFEFISKDIGSQGTICGGGRYNNLIAECGGDPTPAVGFGLGLERLMLTIEAQQGKQNIEPSRDIFIGAIGEQALEKAHGLVYRLRKAGISAEADHLKKSVKAQMKYADKIGALYSVVLGEDEIDKDQVNLKNMKTREQQEIKLSEFVSTITQIIKK